MSVNVEDLVARKTSLGFPNIQVPYEVTLPLVATDLEEGDVQVIFEYQNSKRVVARISNSPKNAKIILDCIGSFKFNKTETESYTISKIEDYLEVV